MTDSWGKNTFRTFFVIRFINVKTGKALINTIKTLFNKSYYETLKKWARVINLSKRLRVCPPFSLKTSKKAARVSHLLKRLRVCPPITFYSLLKCVTYVGFMLI